MKDTVSTFSQSYKVFEFSQEISMMKVNMDHYSFDKGNIFSKIKRFLLNHNIIKGAITVYLITQSSYYILMNVQLIRLIIGL